MKIIVFLILFVFGLSNVGATNYTLDDVVNIYNKNFIKKVYPIIWQAESAIGYTELFKTKDGIDVITTYGDDPKEIIPVKYNEKENTLSVDYESGKNSALVVENAIAMDYVTSAILQLSPHYEEIITKVIFKFLDKVEIPGYSYEFDTENQSKIHIKMEVSDKAANYIYEKYVKDKEKPSTNNPSTSATNYTVDDIINASKTNYLVNCIFPVDPGKIIKSNDGGIDIIFDRYKTPQHVKYNKNDNTLEIYNKKDSTEDTTDSLPVSYSYLSYEFIGACLSQISPHHKEIMNYIYYEVDPAITNKFIMNQDNEVKFPGFEYKKTQNEIHVKMELSNKAANYVYKTYINKDVEIPEEPKPIENSEEQKPIVTPDKQKPTESKPEEQPSKNNNTDGENPPTGAFLNIGLLSFVAIGAIIGITINRRNKKIHKI